MSLSHGLATAITGLRASSKGAEIVSANIANMRTEGFRRRDLQLQSLATAGRSGGVGIVGVTRAETPIATADRRLSLADSSASTLLAGFHKRLETRIGLPTDSAALTTRVDALETALIAAATSPENSARLEQVAFTALSVADHLRELSVHVQQERMTADRAIERDVATLNSSLEGIAELNVLIRKAGKQTDTTALADQRQALVDRIAPIMQLREVAKPDGGIALYSTGGVVLLDGAPARFAFEPAGVITHELSRQGGNLSGLSVNGRALRVDGPDSQLGLGQLAAHFALRDTLAPDAQTRLDTLALDLGTRLQAADTTLAANQPGLLTDGGLAIVPGQQSGLASRLALNATLTGPTPEHWRLRSGFGAATPSPAGEHRVLSALATVLQRPAPPSAPSGSGVPRSMSGQVADTLSVISTARLAEESRLAFSTSRSRALELIEASASVDSDREMQLLLQIERAYAANARVIETVDRMFDSLFRTMP
jgi:flagellar hook-associated protein 1